MAYFNGKPHETKYNGMIIVRSKRGVGGGILRTLHAYQKVETTTKNRSNNFVSFIFLSVEKLSYIAWPGKKLWIFLSLQ